MIALNKLTAIKISASVVILLICYTVISNYYDLIESKGFIAIQSVQESFLQFILKIAVTTVIYFKFSIFLKRHTLKRVFVSNKSRKLKKVKISETVKMKEVFAIN